jgi:hypothetical protein
VNGPDTIKRELFDESPPRSDGTIQRCTADALSRTKRYARRAGIGVTLTCLSLLGFVGVFMLVNTPNVDVAFAFQLGTVMLIYGWLIPLWAVRHVILRDVKALKRLARDGLAQRVTRFDVLRYRRDLNKGLRLYWHEDDKEVGAEFELRRPSLEPFDLDQMFVVARRRDSFVLASLGPNGVFVGKRRGLFGTVN